MRETHHRPTRAAAQRIARVFAGEDVVELDRYETGLCHWVYRFETATGRVFVLRVARPDNRDYIAGGIANGRMLEVIDGIVQRSLGWLDETGLDAVEEAKLVQRRLDELRPALREVRPVPFLDDLTTKNVLVHQGRLSGIVDVDELCYGDRMLWVGLTRMALLNGGHDVEYAEELLDELGADSGDRQRCDFYVGLFTFVFLSEQGVAFNGDGGEPDTDNVAHLHEAVRTWLA